MIRNLSGVVAFAVALVLSLPDHGQDSPSLGDLARQAQKDKTNKPPAKVITNDDMPSRSGGGSSVGSGALGGPSGKLLQPGAADTDETIKTPAEGLEKLQSMLDQVDSLDRDTLASNVLQGNTANFPGRAAWETKLFAAKQAFVSQGRALLEKAKQIDASAQGIKDVQDPNDPRVKSLNAKLQQLVQDNQQNAATFKAVIAEGEDLAAR